MPPRINPQAEGGVVEVVRLRDKAVEQREGNPLPQRKGARLRQKLHRAAVLLDRIQKLLIAPVGRQQILADGGHPKGIDPVLPQQADRPAVMIGVQVGQHHQVKGGDPPRVELRGDRFTGLPLPRVDENRMGSAGVAAAGCCPVPRR